MSELTELRNYLRDVPAGVTAFGFAQDIERLLYQAWSSLTITTGDANLEPYKLLHRVENLAWNPPLLTFAIERHGATVNGSTKAHVYSWEVNLDKGTAAMGEPKMRQIRSADKKLDVYPIAQEVAALILAGKRDRRLKWTGDVNVRVMIADIIPATVKQTTSSRRKRFRAALDARISSHGWTRTGAKSNSYRKATKAAADVSGEVALRP